MNQWRTILSWDVSKLQRDRNWVGAGAMAQIAKSFDVWIMRQEPNLPNLSSTRYTALLFLSRVHIHSSGSAARASYVRGTYSSDEEIAIDSLLQSVRETDLNRWRTQGSSIAPDEIMTDNELSTTRYKYITNVR